MITTVLWRELFFSWASRMPPRPADSAAAAAYLRTARRPSRSIMDSSGIQLRSKDFIRRARYWARAELNLNADFDFLFERQGTLMAPDMQYAKVPETYQRALGSSEAFQCRDTISV